MIIITSTHLIPKDDGGDYHTVTIIIPNIALLDIESVTSKDITLTMSSPSEAGNPILSNVDNNLWLNVTSIIGSGNTRDISVKIDAPINGLDLKVVSNEHSGSGFGSWGTSQPGLILTSSDQTLVSGIKSGYTMDGANNGFNLKYTVISNYLMNGEITSTTGDNITVTYTLTH